VSWHDAISYCNWKSKQTGKKFRLPTEAEWEYAAREGGKKLRFGNGKNEINYQNANFDAAAIYKKSYSIVGEFRKNTVAVTDLKTCNALGLCHMTGNVWEWCSNTYIEYFPNNIEISTNTQSEANRILRGGSWYCYPEFSRVADRLCYTPAYRSGSIGFRVAFSSQ
jgi:formylglycine-generating enzyme